MNAPELQSTPGQPKLFSRTPAQIRYLHPRVQVRIFGKTELQKPLLAFTQSPKYQGLSCAEQNKALRQKERELLLQMSGTSQERLFDLEQVHGARAVLVEGHSRPNRPRADALFTAEPGLGLFVRTADCLPVFFAMEGPGPTLVAGIIHSGWRGTKEQIVSKTLRQAFLYAKDLFLENTSESSEEKMAWKLFWAIGPAISQTNYEVDGQVAGFFSHCKPAKREGHFLLDLSAEVRDQVSSFCTSHHLQEHYNESWEACVFDKNDCFYSHRRGDQFRNLNMIEIIAKKPRA